MPLTYKQSRFVDEYLIDLNATKAAARAGYSRKTANEQGARLLANVGVRFALDEAMRERAARTRISADLVLCELARIAFFDPRTLFDTDGFPKAIVDLDSQTAAALASFEIATEVVSTGPHATTTIRRYKLVDKGVALEKLAKHLGLYEQSRKSPQDALAEILMTMGRSSLPISSVFTA